MSDSAPAIKSEQWLSRILGVISRVPLPILYVLADAIFLLSYYVLRFQRALIINNLRAAFPNREDAEIQKTAVQTYRNTVHMLFESIKGATLGKQALCQRVEIENPQLIDELLQQHKVVITVASHHANWEWLQLVCSARLHAPLAALFKPLNHPGVDIPLLKTRSRFGSILIEVANALPEVIKFSRDGGIVALVADQGPRPEDEKHWATFLGRDTAFYTGPEKLARVLKAPLVFVRMQRLRRGYYRIGFDVLTKPPYSQPYGAIMDEYIRAVEQQVLQAPQDWVWMYKRWKHKRPLYE